MSSRALALGLLVAALSASVSCTAPPFGEPQEEYSSIPGIHAGQTPDEVLRTLGHPQVRENGWWVMDVWFDMEFHVWYYKKVGRVIFDRYMIVFASEADPRQEGRAN